MSVMRGTTRRLTTETFDTLQFANRLKAAGIPDKQAEAEAEALADALQINLKPLGDSWFGLPITW